MFPPRNDPLRQLLAVNQRVNSARAPGPLKPGEGFVDDGVYDCDDYAHAKYFAPDLPQGPAYANADVTLPDGRKHRVVIATYKGREYVMDNLTNALLTRQDREREGWRFQVPQYSANPFAQATPKQTAENIFSGR